MATSCRFCSAVRGASASASSECIKSHSMATSRFILQPRAREREGAHSQCCGVWAQHHPGSLKEYVPVEPECLLGPFGGEAHFGEHLHVLRLGLGQSWLCRDGRRCRSRGSGRLRRSHRQRRRGRTHGERSTSHWGRYGEDRWHCARWSLPAYDTAHDCCVSAECHSGEGGWQAVDEPVEAVKAVASSMSIR
jgi:hypothetical protein